MDRWIAERTKAFDSSGIRKVFDLAAQLKDPVNLSIGQPDFDVPEPIRQECIRAVESAKNGYSPTQGLPVLREKLQRAIGARYGHADRQVFVSSGTSGGLTLALMSLVNAGDEVIVFDPYFVMYEPLVKLVNGTPVLIDTYPDFKIDLERVAAAITPRTKMILFNSPANPTGVVASRAEVEGLAKLAAEQEVVLVSDEIYSRFCYDSPFVSPAEFNEQTLVIDGFSKSHAMTGWRIGFVHGPSQIIQTMIKLQQYTFVCAPQPAQWAALAAWEFDTTELMKTYARKRDRIVAGLRDDYELVAPAGAFYAFPRVPRGSATEFVTRAIENHLLIIPGKIFSGRDTHFRLSYAADDQTLDRGLEILRRLAR
jgi:aspartate/methionine/tyrosine aminotransferase